MYIDAIGKECPIPVVLAKKELDGGCQDLTIVVDNKIAVENLTRLAKENGSAIAVAEKDGAFQVRLTRSAAAAPAAAPAPVPAAAAGGYAVFVGKDHVGEGAQELGYNLMKMALYTLSQGDDAPAYLLFMNGGVKLPAGEEQQVLDSIAELIEKGTEVLVCGTCLNYYTLADQLKVGTISNMYEILNRMQRASKVITL
ncbi:MAG: sulfurtransferase-like selenium metabolism protein YedF [Christensenellaceae bacterium]|jgi:selenium metabolism protein YedF|nr:sulfurtransferase-like selenium metabolism protein YedF [Christensenellaceae bacterium]